MKHVEYTTKGVCSFQVNFDLDDDILRNVNFYGGCDGNLKAIATLVEGMKAKDVQEKLRGNTCGMRSTSCADQLAKAIEDALA